MRNHYAQGTVEYLIIIAVVVVLSLVVVALIATIFSSPSQQIGSSSDKLGQVAVGGISIVEAVTDLDGDSLIKLSNNSNDVITLTKISVGNSDNNYAEQLVGLDSKTFSLNGLSNVCKCSAGQKNVTCQFKIEYFNANGILMIDYKTVTAQCVIDSVSGTGSNVVNPITNTVLDSIAPSVLLLSPSDGNIFSGRTLVFDFNATDNELISFCTLHVGSDSNTYTGLNNGLNTIRYTKQGDDGLFDWNIICSDGINSSASVSRNITMDANALQIASCLELQDMNKNLSGNYELMNNIDCGYDTNSSSGRLWNGGYGFSPIGSCGTELGTCQDNPSAFKGSLTSNGYIINGLYINRYSSQGVGLFGYYKGNLTDIHLENVNIKGNIYVGGIAAYLNGFISNSSVLGDVNGYASVGGLFGNFVGAMSECYFKGNIVGNGGGLSIGGLAGEVAEYSQSEVSLISNCYFSGSNISPASSYVGGLVGSSLGASVYDSYSEGTIQGYSYVGGLVGSFSMLNAMGPVVVNSFSTSSISGNNYTGGLLGENYVADTPYNSYWDKILTNVANCYTGYDAEYNPVAMSSGCQFTTNNASWYYSSSNAPLSDWTFGVDGNWVTTESYPILAWQSE